MYVVESRLVPLLPTYVDIVLILALLLALVTYLFDNDISSITGHDCICHPSHAISPRLASPRRANSHRRRWGSPCIVTIKQRRLPAPTMPESTIPFKHTSSALRPVGSQWPCLVPDKPITAATSDHDSSPRLPHDIIFVRHMPLVPAAGEPPAPAEGWLDTEHGVDATLPRQTAQAPAPSKSLGTIRFSNPFVTLLASP